MDLEFALGVLEDILCNPEFDNSKIEKVRDEMISNLKSLWDSNVFIAKDLAKKHIYGGHPYVKNGVGTEDSLKAVCLNDIASFHKKYVTPVGATCAVVGDLDDMDIEGLLRKTLGRWNGDKVDEIDFPEIKETKRKKLKHYIDRDQVVVMLAGLSVKRDNPDYYKLILLNDIVMGGMHSKMFKLREQTGIFYGWGGDFVAHSDEQPGFMGLMTLVSKDRLEELEAHLKDILKSLPETITQEELDNTRNSLIYGMAEHYSTNSSVVGTFLHLNRFGLPYDYYNNVIQKLSKITLDELKDAAKKHVDVDRLCIVNVGRVDD